MTSREYFRGKTALITGASSGIGEELARQLAYDGATLTLVARRKAMLQSLADDLASSGAAAPLVVDGDVTRDGDIERAVAASVERWGKLDVVIANAGFGVVGTFRDLTIEDYRRQFETNVFGVLRTIYAALPEIEKTRGHVVIVGSVAGWVSTPGTSPYAMSKFALRALADAITPELRAVDVKLTLISPGFVVSNIRRVDNQGAFQADAPDAIPAWLVVDTTKAVRQMLKAVSKGKREAIVTGHGKILVALQRFAPWAVRAATRKPMTRRDKAVTDVRR
jgi:short-subunit dehydrogenase